MGQLEPGARKKKKKKKKKKRQAIPEAPGSSQAREEDVAARLVHTKSQIDVLTRQLSGGAGGRTAEPPRTVSTELVRTKTQIAQLTRELSGVAGGGRSGAAESEDDVLDAQLRALGKEVYQIRPDGDCLFSAVLDQLTRMETRSAQQWAEAGPGALRMAAATTIRGNADDYAPFLTEGNNMTSKNDQFSNGISIENHHF